jgi:hypothetical protein
VTLSGRALMGVECDPLNPRLVSGLAEDAGASSKDFYNQ